MPNIELFKASFDDLARANRYRVEGFGAPDDLKYMAKAATAPASTVGVVDAPYQGRIIKLPGDRTYADWDVTFSYNTNNEDYDYFYQLHSFLNLEIANISIGLSDGKLPYGSVTLLNRTNGADLKTWTIVGAIPFNISEIQFGMDTNDTLAEFTVSLAYDYHLVT